MAKNDDKINEKTLRRRNFNFEYIFLLFASLTLSECPLTPSFPLFTYFLSHTLFHLNYFHHSIDNVVIHVPSFNFFPSHVAGKMLGFDGFAFDDIPMNRI